MAGGETKEHLMELICDSDSERGSFYWLSWGLLGKETKSVTFPLIISH